MYGKNSPAIFAYAIIAVVPRRQAQDAEIATAQAVQLI